MIHRAPRFLSALAAAALILSACGSTPTGPELTDPAAIVTAAVTSTKAAKSVHLDVTVDGSATVALPIGGGAPTTLDLTGTTAAADIDFVRPAARATFALKAGLTVSGELIAVDGKTYLKSSLTGPLYQASPAGSLPIDPTNVRGMIETLGDLLLKPGVTLTKGADIACGSKSCYTVTTDLTADALGTAGASALDGLPVDLTGATFKLTLRVEKDLPYHLAGLSAVVSHPTNAPLTIELTASKWDAPVTVTAPPADQVKPAS